MSFRILLVDPDPTTVAITESALVEAGHRVAWVSTFEEATQQLSLDYPDLLITSIRLGAFNGMHLMFRFRAEHPDVPVIVIDALADLTPDMRRPPTRFLSPPIDRASFVALVSELLAGRTPRDPNSLRRWPRKRAELPATIHRNIARVVELSYGGLRLEMTAAPAEGLSPLEIELPSLGMSVMAVPRWLRPVEDGGSWWCGAEIALPGSDAARQWHYIVDSLR
jgi:CheY-like chemotaxis protein